MNALLKSIEKNIQSINSGNADLKVFDETIKDVQALLEKLYIIRYKAYLGERPLPTVNPEKSPEPFVNQEESTLSFDFTKEPLDLIELMEKSDSADKTEVAIETPVLKEVLIQKDPLPEPAINFQDNAAINLKEAESPISNPPDSLDTLKTTSSEQETPNHIPSETSLENLFELALEASSSIHFNLSEIIAHTPRGETIDTLIGCFSLKEKLQCINHLFDGSSEVFAFSIKKLDECTTLEEAESNLIYLSNKHNWKEQDIASVQVLVVKVKSRYA